MSTERPSAFGPNFSEGDEIAMTGTVSIVHDEQHGRGQISVRLGGFDYPLTPVEMTWQLEFYGAKL